MAKLNKLQPPCVVSIAGSDPSGGAGIQADIKSISATGSYAAAIITALTAQNTQGVHAITNIELAFLQQQIETVFNDLTVDAVKIGMLHNTAIITLIARMLKLYPIKNIVLDPVMIAKNGCDLLMPDTIAALKQQLFPLTYLITPNCPETEKLLDIKITNTQDMQECAIELGQNFHTNVLIKGGHLHASTAADVLYLYQDNTIQWFSTKRIATNNTHGTGCTLSSAIASYLAQRYNLTQAVSKAKTYLTKAIISSSQFHIGHGCGPVDHFYMLK